MRFITEHTASEFLSAVEKEVMYETVKVNMYHTIINVM